MTTPARLTLPTFRITDPLFKYTPAHRTDIRMTWHKAREILEKKFLGADINFCTLCGAFGHKANACPWLTK